MDGDAVAEGSHEIDPELNAAPSVPIRLLEDTEDLEPPDDMLHGQSHLRALTSVSPLGLHERVILARVLRRPSERVLVMNPLIPSVGEAFGVRINLGLRRLQASKIMRRPTTRGHAEDLARERMDQALQFQRGALLVPTDQSRCFFWGVHRAPHAHLPRPP